LTIQWFIIINEGAAAISGAVDDVKCVGLTLMQKLPRQKTFCSCPLGEDMMEEDL